MKSCFILLRSNLNWNRVYRRVRDWTSGRSLPVWKFVKYPPGLIITPRLRMVVYHLHGQTGWFTVWVNGKKNSGLVNFTPESRFNLYKSVSFSEKRPLKPEPGVKDGFDRSKKCNTNFRWKIHSAQENRIALSNGPLLPKMFHWNDLYLLYVIHSWTGPRRC